VQFVTGEHDVIFKCVTKNYKEAKQVHNIGGPIPIILVENETKVKSIVSWDFRGDNLIGFCAAKENHCCVTNFNHVIGIREDGYNNVLEAFTNNKITSFARVMIVNLLHEKLPRLVLVVHCICNYFNVNWVQQQWNVINVLWKLECQAIVGPIVGHASDGDSCRYQLMLANYTI
jgi:hypothetical protein